MMAGGDVMAWDVEQVGNRIVDGDAAFLLPHGRGDEFHHGSPVPDPRGFPKGPRARDIVDPYLHLDAIKVKTRDFR
ncbi:DNA polymerase [Rhizobium rhizogenes]|jgi:error-prone DNA polymerase|nr:DNA polymerase [Rhizobium rhizogenes]